MMKPSLALVTFLILSCTLYAQQIDQSLLTQVAEVRKTDCDSALSILSQSRLESLTDDAIKAQAYLELGYTHYCLGNFDSALKSYQLSLDEFKNLNAKSKPAEILNLIGTLQKKQGNFELAEQYFEDGLEYALSKNDSLGIGNSLNNIGVLLFQQEKFEKSLDFYQKSTIVKCAIRDTIGLSYNYDNLGMNYSKLEMYDSAQHYLNLAAEYKLIIGDKLGYGIVKNNIGEMLLQLGELNRAEVYFNQALKIAQEVSHADFERHILGMISKIKEERGNYQEALSFYKDHVKINDSLFNERKSQQVAELETKYQTEKKETEIQTQKAEIQRKNFLLIGASGAIFIAWPSFYTKQAET